MLLQHRSLNSSRMLSLLSLEGPLEAKEEPVIVHDDTTLHQEPDVHWFRNDTSLYEMVKLNEIKDVYRPYMTLGSSTEAILGLVVTEN